MEQPLRRNELDPNQPFEGDAGNLVKHNKVPHLAGHISLHELPHDGEISLEQQKPQVDRIERSAWHNIAIDKENHVIEQQYGQAFQQELKPEQLAQSKAVAGQVIAAAQMNPAASPLAQQLPTQPISTPGQPTPVPVNPLYATMNGSQNTPGHPVPETSVPTVPTQPYSPVSAASPEQQGLTATPLGGHQPTPVTLSGAINPSFAQPALPSMTAEPQLPAGQPTRVDVQHRLPASKQRLKLYLTSPWLWLAIGLLMIIYFAGSVFNS